MTPDLQSTMTSIVAPDLVTVGGALSLTNNDKLATLEMPALVTVGGSIGGGGGVFTIRGDASESCPTEAQLCATVARGSRVGGM